MRMFFSSLSLSLVVPPAGGSGAGPEPLRMVSFKKTGNRFPKAIRLPVRNGSSGNASDAPPDYFGKVLKPSP